MSQLPDNVSRMLGRTVVDETGLNETYDFHAGVESSRQSLFWTRGVPPSGPTVFTAMQEQLGRKLDSKTAPPAGPAAKHDH
jgi:uncharacterized protein (TIGR03435 family)